jgi:hypothetical protein
MHRGVLSTFEVLRELAGDVLPEWLPLLLSLPDVLPLKEGYFEPQFLLKEC